MQNLFDFDRERARRRRYEMGLTGADLAKKIGVSRSYISQMDRGMFRPSPEKLQAIAAALELEPTDLVRSTTHLDSTVEVTQ